MSYWEKFDEKTVDGRSFDFFRVTRKIGVVYSVAPHGRLPIPFAKGYLDQRDALAEAVARTPHIIVAA